MVLKGICSLAFEGHEFTPTRPDGSAAGPTLWVSIGEETKAELAGMLGVDVGELEFVGAFEAEVIGEVHLCAGGVGHLSMYPGAVEIQQVLTAKLPVRDTSGPRYGSIRELLKAAKRSL